MRAKLLESGNVLLDTGKGMVTVGPSHDDYLKLRQRLARPANLSETQKLRNIAVANYSRLSNDLRKVKDETFSSPAALMRFVDSIAERVTQGLVKEGALHRTEDSPKHHFTDVAELPAARQQFAEELYDRLNDPAADPVETAGWVNWRLDLTDHFYSDGVAKTAEALSEFILARAGLDAPTYDPSEAFANAPREKFSPANGGRSYTRCAAYAKWQGYYRSQFPNDLDARAAKRYALDDSEQRRDLWQRIKAAAADVDTSPTDAQKKSGTYKKGHVTVQGLPITIENPAGSTRSGTSKDGEKWQVKMGSHYGYIKRADSADGDNLDVFIGPEPTSEIVFVIDQLKKDSTFDELKCMIGWTNDEDAKRAYLANYSPGWKGFGGMKALTMPAFKHWLETGDTGKPIEGQRIHYERAGIAKRYAWDESEHPRGQPGNAGQFGQGGGASTQTSDSQPPSKRMAPWLRHRDDFLVDAFKSAKKDTDVEVKLKKQVAAQLSSRMAKMGVTADAAKAFTASLPDDEKFSEDPIENAAAHLVSSWATTSNDHDHLARAIQETCAKVFGITNHFSLAQTWNPDNEPLTDKGAKKIIAKHAPVLEAFLKATYAATQEHFKDLGMTHVAVYRGMSIAPTDKQQIKPDEEMQLQPMSSFSASYDTARGFGLTASAKESSAMIAATIPVKRVISTCFSGPGCLSEDELVVLGGTAHCSVGYFPRIDGSVATIPHEEDQFLKLLREQKP